MAKRDRSTGRTWLDGPTIPAPYDDDTPAKWPGEKLGPRRAGGVAIDWVICWIVAGFLHMFTTYLGDTATLTLMLFVILGIISVALFARTPGQALLGMGVARVDQRDQRVGLARAAARTLLTIFVLPAAMVDTDGRGMHDRATGTAVILG